MEDRQLHLSGIDSKVGDATLYLEAEQARILMADGELLVIPRAEQPERLHANRMLGGAALLVRRGKKRIAWKLDDGQFETVQQWIGPPRQEHLAFALKQRYGLGLPIGLFLILTALPYPGDPAAGLDPMPLNVVSTILGGGLIVLWAFSRWRPHPSLFILDAAWFALLALDTVYDIATGESSMWWILFAAVVMVFAQSGLGLYKRYQHLHSAAPA